MRPPRAAQTRRCSPRPRTSSQRRSSTRASRARRPRACTRAGRAPRGLRGGAPCLLGASVRSDTTADGASPVAAARACECACCGGLHVIGMRGGVLWAVFCGAARYVDCGARFKKLSKKNKTTSAVLAHAGFGRSPVPAPRSRALAYVRRWSWYLRLPLAACACVIGLSSLSALGCLSPPVAPPETTRCPARNIITRRDRH